MERALADEHGHLLARVQNLGRAVEIGIARQDARRLVARARVHGAVGVWRLRDRRRLLDVVGDDDRGDGPFRKRDSARPIDEVADLRGLHGHLHELVRDVLEQRLQVDLLLIVAAEAGARLLADDRDDRRVVELRVVEPVEKVDGAGAGRRHAHADLPGDLRVRARDEFRPLAVARALECAHDAIDAVARVAVHALDAPCCEAIEQVVANGLTHAHCSFLIAGTRSCAGYPRQTPG